MIENDESLGCGHSRRRVALIVDDFSEVRDILRDIVTGLGLDTVEAGDGYEAFDRFCEGEYAIVITNIYMPKMNGFHLVDFVRAVAPQQPILVLSGAPAIYYDALHHRYPHLLHTLQKPLPYQAVVDSIRELASLSDECVTGQ